MRGSYTSASCFPIKLLQDGALLESLRAGRIPPYHVQLYPTDRCNLKCTFCSCANKDGARLTLSAVARLADELPLLGCRAVTISGGGEPLCHPQLNEIIGVLADNGLQVGLTTNGLLLDRLATGTLRWCRISCCDERPLDAPTSERITRAVERFPAVDWALSYVVSDRCDLENLRRHVELAGTLEMTHVRVVADLFSQGASFADARAALAGIDQRVIYQARKDFTRGRAKCLIGLLKPVVSADGWVYPCCGAQYAHEPPDRKLPANMRICRMTELSRLSQPFDGRQCVRCYYDAYNELLDLLTSDVRHGAFV